MSAEADVRWTGDAMARLAWKCLTCGATGLEAEQRGDYHRKHCARASVNHDGRWDTWGGDGVGP